MFLFRRRLISKKVVDYVKNLAIIITMKFDFNNLEVKRKINLLAEICHYGIEWNRDSDGEHRAYVQGGIETTAHILSCCIVQWFGFEFCGTGETRSFLQMETAAKEEKAFSIPKWEFLIQDYLLRGIDGQEP